MNLNVNAILKLILFERILMYTLCDLSNRDLVQYWLQNCSYFINVTALLKTIVFDAYLLKTSLLMKHLLIIRIGLKLEHDKC